MKKNFSKKGAVELSLNLIIMLIIGMVVLGLVIGFVNSLVNKGTNTFEEQIGDNDRLKLDEISNCADNLCVLPYPTIKATKGQDTKVYFKVRNYKGDDEIDCNPGVLDSTCGFGYEIVDSDGDSVNIGDGTIKIRGQGFPGMKSGEEASKMYIMELGPDMEVGTYYITFGLYDSFEEDQVVVTLEVE